MEESDIDIIVAAKKEAILMVEGATRFIKGDDLIEAIHFGHQSLLPLIECQENLRARYGKDKWLVKEEENIDELKKEMREKVETELLEAFSIPTKAVEKGQGKRNF